MKRTDTYKTILYCVFGLAVVAGLFLVFFPFSKTIPEPKISPASGETIGLITPIYIAFPTSMDHSSVEARIDCEPALALNTSWYGNTLIILPKPAFPMGESIKIRLKSGAASQSGVAYRTDQSWLFNIRTPSIAYLGQATTAPEIWISDGVSGEQRQVTQSSGRISDFAVIPDGTGLIFTIPNNQGGVDIHRINSDGSNDAIQQDCGKETCGNPAISRLGNLIAFTLNRDPESLSTSTKSYIYTSVLFGNSEAPTPLITEKSIQGILPSFSPDGLKMSFYDSTGKGLRVTNKGIGNDFLLGTSRIHRGTWSPDGKYLAFVDDENELGNTQSRLYSVNLESSSIDEPFKDVLVDVEMGEPDWSPDGKSIVIGIRKTNGPIARQLWLLDLENKTARQITDNLTVMNAAPKWRPDGKAIAIQQAELGSSGIKPKVVEWDSETGKFTTIAIDAAMPAWVP
jgi:Tol biopolymer transport system component